MPTSTSTVIDFLAVNFGEVRRLDISPLPRCVVPDTTLLKS